MSQSKTKKFVQCHLRADNVHSIALLDWKTATPVGGIVKWSDKDWTVVAEYRRFPIMETEK